MKHLLQAKTDSLFSNSLFIFLIRFFPSLANVLVVIFFSRALPTADYGLYQSFWTHLFVLSAVACMGIQTFTLTYSPGTVKALLQRLHKAFYIGFALWLLLISLVFAWLQHDSMTLGWFVPLAFSLVYALSVIGESFLIVFKQFRKLVWANFLYTAAFCLVHLSLLRQVIGWQELFVLLLTLGLLRLIIYLIILRKQMSADVSTEQLDSLSGFRTLWLHLGVYDVSQILFRWVDKFIVSFIVGQELFAIYMNGSIDIPFLPLLLGAVGGAGLMRLAQRNLDDTQLALQLVNMTGKMLSCIVFPLFFFFVCFRYELFAVVLSNKYLAAVPIFLMSVLAIPLRAYSFTTILQNRHKGTIINIGAIFDLLLACCLMYPLYMLIGLPGVALSFVVSSYLQAAYYLYHTARTLEVGILSLIPLGNWLLKLVVFAVVFIGVHYCFSLFFGQVVTLIFGVVVTALAAMISLSIEYKNTRPYGESTASEKS